MSTVSRRSTASRDVPEPVEEEEERKTIFSGMRDALYDAYMDLIPSDEVKTYHPKYLMPLSLIIIVMMLGLFAAFFVPSYRNEVTSRFLSPTELGTSKYCEPVKISNTGTFYATKEGYWSGSSGYTYSNSSYFITISNLAITTEQYTERMSEIYNALQFLGNLSRANDLGSNLLIWMSFLTIPDGMVRSQRFANLGNPLNVFNRERTVASIGSYYGACFPTGTTASFSKSEGLISVSFPYDSFLADPICPYVITPQYFGYDETLDSNKVQLSLDVRTIITSVALNLAILGKTAVEPIPNTVSSFLYTLSNGVEVQVNYSRFYDARYPGMKPVTCVTDAIFPFICVIELGALVALPVFRHKGSSDVFPIPCNCTTLSQEELDDQEHNCNLFDFLTGLVFYDNATPQAMFTLALRYSYQELQQHIFDPMFIDSGWGIISPNFDYFASTAVRDSVYNFCDLGSLGVCSVVIFTSFDQFDFDYTVNEFYYQIPKGACRDIFTTSEENWQRLVDYPFAPLNQQYLVCRNTLQNALINSVGVSVSNTQLLTPILILLVLLLILGYERCTGGYVPRGYHQKLKDEVLDDLAVLLLLGKEKRLRVEGEWRENDKGRNLLVSRLGREMELLGGQLGGQFEPTSEREAGGLCGQKGEGKGKEDGENKDVEEGVKDGERTQDKGKEREKKGEVEMHYGHYGIIPMELEENRL